MTDPESVKEAAKAVEKVAEVAPEVYKDVFQPSAQEVGKGLHTVTKTMLIALAPLKALVWGWEHFEEFLSTKVAEKLSETPPEEIIGPKLHIAGPALDALRFTGHEDSLSDLYANLLATSMDIKTVSFAHPSFVEIIRQMTPDEARLVSYFAKDVLLPVISVKADLVDGTGFRDVVTNFSLLGEAAGCEHTHLTPTYLDNLARLGVIAIPETEYTEPDSYDELENHASIIEATSQVNTEEGFRARIKHNHVEITQLGRQFVKACVVDHQESKNTETS